MNIIEKNKITWLLCTAVNTINSLSDIINTAVYSEDLCHFCSHFPMGGDGDCQFDCGEKCNFSWRYADNVEQMITLLNTEGV